jgi:hypothetical protein
VHCGRHPLARHLEQLFTEMRLGGEVGETLAIARVFDAPIVRKTGANASRRICHVSNMRKSSEARLISHYL